MAEGQGIKPNAAFRQFLLVIDCPSNYLSSLNLSDGFNDGATAIVVFGIKRLGASLLDWLCCGQV